MNEREISQALAERENGQCEVRTPVGSIDVLTAKYVYEVKAAPDWKAATGQVLAYQAYYPNHKPRLYLYGKPTLPKKTIEEHCRTLGIVVVWHRDEDQRAPQPKAPKPPKPRFDIELQVGEWTEQRDRYVKMQYHVAFPQTPPTEAQLQAYLNEFRDILDPLLKYELRLTLDYAKGDTHIQVASRREYTNPHPTDTDLKDDYRELGLVLWYEMGERKRHPLRFPCAQTIHSGEKAFKRACYPNRTARILVETLDAFIKRPGWCWRSSARGEQLGKLWRSYLILYRLDLLRGSLPHCVMKVYDTSVDMKDLRESEKEFQKLRRRRR